MFRVSDIFDALVVLAAVSTMPINLKKTDSLFIISMNVTKYIYICVCVCVVCVNIFLFSVSSHL